MPHYFVKLECRQLERRWSYNWFAESATAAAALASQATTNFMRRFADVHAPLTLLKRISVARTASVAEPIAPREVSRKELNLSGSAPDFGGSSLEAPDLVEVAIRLNLVSNGGPARSLDLRGVPDNLVGRRAADGLQQLGGALLTKVDALVDAFAAGTPALVRALVPHTDPAAPWRNVKQLAPATGSDGVWTTVTTVQPHGFVVGSRVLFGGEIDCNVESLSGGFEVLDFTADTFTIATRFRGAVSPLPVRRVRVRKALYNFWPIVVRLQPNGPRLSGFKEFAKRDTGSGSTKRGRRRGKSCRA
jgi:hypothetical protein